MILSTGKNVYQFAEKTGVNDDPINVYYYRSKNWTKGDAIAFVLHGTNRDAERYLDDWTSYADKNNVLVVCPEFSEEKYPGSRYYNIGNVMDSTGGNGKLQDKEDWIFPVINRIMSDLKIKVDSSDSKTLLYGHSAGAQMVHRYVLFDGDTNFDLIVSANAGWYTMPDGQIPFPYGTAGVTLNDEDLAKALKKSVVILLGENDTVRDSNLRVTEEADNQGKNRLERGKNFYEQMKNKAAELGVPFNWKLSLVPNVGHSDYSMAKSAIEIFSDKITDIEPKIISLVPGGNSIKNADENVLFQYNAGDGNHKVIGFNSTSTLSISGANYSSTKSGNDLIFTVGKSKITLTGAANLSAVNIDGVKGTPTTFTVKNSILSPVTISSAIKVVDASKRTNAIKITGNKLANTIKGGAGNDTLTGGEGNDLFVYSSGNDVITDYSYEDTVKISSGKIDSYSFEGGDLIFKIGDGSLKLKNMTNHAVTVKDSLGTTTKIYSNGYSPQQVIKNLVQSWNKTILQSKSTAKLDEAIQACSHFKSIQDVIDKMVADCRKAGDAEIFLRDYCGIILDNEDSGAITGWDAGGLKIKSNDNIIPETLSTLKHVPDYTDTNFKTSQGVTINISSTSDSLTADGKKVFDALYSWWADEAINLIEESYGVKFNDSHKIYFSLVPKADYWGQTSGSYVRINMAPTYFSSDDDYNGNNVDKCITHEFTHVAQNLFMGYFPQFLEEGFAELTGGIDKDRRLDIRNLAGNADSLASSLDINKYGTGEGVYYAAGFMFYRYLAKQASDSYDRTGAYSWKNNVLINGTYYDDLLRSAGNKQTITAGAGNDTIIVYSKNSSIDGGDGYDRIFTGKDTKKLTIEGGTGADRISLGGNGYNKILYRAGDGDDSISGFSRTDTLSISGATYTSLENINDIILTVGSNKITLVGAAQLNKVNVKGTQRDNEMLTLSEGADNYTNTLDSATLNALGDNDYLLNKGNIVSINGGEGNDDINNHGTNVTIEGGIGNDVIRNWSGEYGNGNNVTISGGTGSDTVLSGGTNVLIKGDSGNDSIWSWGNFVTIEGGKGNDTLSLSGYGKLIQYTAGDGKDSIIGFDETSTLQIGDGTGTYSSTKSGSDIIVTVGKGKITLKGAASLSAIHINDKKNGSAKKGIVSLSSGDDKYENGVNNVTINALGGNDNVYNYGTNVSIAGGKGNDNLRNFEADDVTINAGAGDDTVYNRYGQNVLINAVSGKNSIGGNMRLVTINGGTGDDYINPYHSSSGLTVNAGKGNDTIEGGTFYNALIYAEEGNDCIRTYGGSMTIDAGKGNDLVSIGGYDDWLIDGGEGNDSIINYSGNYVTIDAGDGDDSINNNSSTVKISGGNGKDTIRNDSYGRETTIKGGSDNDVIINYANIVEIEGGSGNDSITGYASNVTITSGTGNDTINLSGRNLIYRYTPGDGNDTILNYSESNVLNITKGTYKKRIYGNDIIVKVGKGSILLKDAKNKNLNIAVTDNLDNGLIFNEEKDSVSITADNISNFFNADNYSKLETIIATEHSDAMAIKSNNRIRLIESGAGNDTISSIQNYTSVSTGAGDDRIINKGSRVTITAGEGNDSIYGGEGRIQEIYGGAGDDTVYSQGDYSLIDGGEGDDRLTIQGGDSTVRGGGGNDSLYNAGYNRVLLEGGKGDDTIKNNYGSDVTIVGGAGNDLISLDSYTKNTLIEYAAGDGNDLIQGFKDNSTLSISGANYSSTKSGNDLIFTIGKNKITLTGAANLSAVNIDGVKGTPTTFTVKNSTQSPVTISSAIKVVDASKRTNAIKITGNKLANTIKGSSAKDTIYGGKGNDKLYGNVDNDKLYGGAGNDSLWGGKGNDTLYGDAGKDTFIYNNGDDKDIIYGFENNDLLKITGIFSGTYNKSKKEIYFKVGSTSNAITLKDFSATSFNINGTNYKISGSALKK